MKNNTQDEENICAENRYLEKLSATHVWHAEWKWPADLASQPHQWYTANDTWKSPKSGHLELLEGQLWDDLGVTTTVMKVGIIRKHVGLGVAVVDTVR